MARTPRERSDFDLIVVGGGSGGLAGAFRAASHGARVALLEPAALGGTCVNVGCVPKKAMWLAANMAGALRQAGVLGFPATDCSLDWPTFIAHRERYIEGIHAGYRRRLDAAGIALLPTRGTLVDAHRVRTEDGVVLAAPHVLLATGGHPVRPGIPGAALGGVSDDFFGWRAAPPTVAVIGGGYIALELAGVLQALGSRVTLRVRRPNVLEGFDEEITAQLLEDYRHLGVDVRLDTATAAVERVEGGLRLRDAGGDWSTPVDEVLFATGRRPTTSGLGLEAAGIATDPGGFVPVDEFGCTAVAGLYAVGDLTPMPALTPVAIAVARRLMDRVFGGLDRAALDLEHVPSVVFSHPPLGAGGAFGNAGARAPRRRGARAARRVPADAARARRFAPAQPVQDRLRRPDAAGGGPAPARRCRRRDAAGFRGGHAARAGARRPARYDRDPSHQCRGSRAHALSACPMSDTVVTETYTLHRGHAPLLVSLPHDGSEIPDALAERMTDAARTAPDTDWHVARLYAFAHDVLGASMLVPRYSRYVVDLNRPPDDTSLYPGQNTTGLCPTRCFSGDDVYRAGQGPDEAEVTARVETYWRPYHHALDTELERLRAMHGRVVLWEGHSIRGSDLPFLFDGRLPDLNLGTAGGASCRPQVQAALEGVLAAQTDYDWVVERTLPRRLHHAPVRTP